MPDLALAAFRILGVRLLLLAVAALSLAACGQQATSDESAWVTYRDSGRGLSVRYPADWHRAETRLAPILGDPVEILSLGTYPLRAGSPRCNNFPVRALEDFRSTDAFISIQERAHPVPAELHPPPGPFAPPTEAHTGRFCIPDDNRLDDWLTFGINGRGFYAIVAIGDQAPEETREELRETLNSLQFDPR